MNALKEGKKAEGSALISALIFSSMLFITSASYLLMVSSEYKLNHRSYNSTVAINLAEGGVDYAVQALESGEISNWSGSDPKTKTLYSLQTAGGDNMGDVSIEVTDPSGDNPVIESTGHVPNLAASGSMSRTVKVKLSPRINRPFDGVLIGKEAILDVGNGYTDSYDSRIGAYGGTNVGSKGHVSTNSDSMGAVDIRGSVEINGNAGTGPQGTVLGEEHVTGTISHDMAMEFPEVEVPPDLAALGYWEGYGLLTITGASSHTLEPGDYKFKRIKMTAGTVLTINGPARIYITGYLNTTFYQTGTTDLICNGKVTFYADDDIKLAGSGSTNINGIPSECLILGTQGCENIDITGSRTMWAAVYAPNAKIDVGGSNNAYGSFVGRKINMHGSTGYHYDEALEETGIPILSGYEVAYWQEKE